MMKRISIALLAVIAGGLLGWLYFGHHGHAQQLGVTQSSGPPSGVCQDGFVDVDVTGPIMYKCIAGTWTLTARPPLKGSTGTITGTLLAVGSCDSGTATVSSATVGMTATTPTATDGTDLAALGFNVQATVTSSNTVTVDICAIVLGTPPSKAYNVAVIP